MPTAVDFFWEVPKKTQRPRYLVNTKFLMIMAPRRTEAGTEIGFLDGQKGGALRLSLALDLFDGQHMRLFLVEVSWNVRVTVVCPGLRSRRQDSGECPGPASRKLHSDPFSWPRVHLQTCESDHDLIGPFESRALHETVLRVAAGEKEKPHQEDPSQQDALSLNLLHSYPFFSFILLRQVHVIVNGHHESNNEEPCRRENEEK